MAERLLAAAVAFVLTLVLTALVRRYALRRGIIDVPNARSSHTSATPRGGGLAIFAIFAALLVGGTLVDRVSVDLALALLPGAALVTLVGLWDDHGHVSPVWRMLAHLVAIAWVLGWLGSVASTAAVVDRAALVGFADVPAPMAWFVTGLVVLALVWFLNLFNFMDGIDGIAATEAVFLAVAGAWLAARQGDHGVALAFWVLGGAAAGFLVWNWPPARIFMGDAGSGFLGFTLAALAFASQPDNAWPWVILPAVFVADASVTLLRRMARGDRWYAAHRSHAYQWSARRWGHLRVTLTVGLANLLWVLPCAVLAFRHPDTGVIMAVVAYLPLTGLALWLGAGRIEAA